MVYSPKETSQEDLLMPDYDQMRKQCPNVKENLEHCNCTYAEPVNIRRASSYLARVVSMISKGSGGAGGFLSQ